MQFRLSILMGVLVGLLALGLLVGGTPAVYGGSHENGDAEVEEEVEEVKETDLVTLEVVATDYQFDPAELTVNPGDTVKLTLVNAGEVVHDLVIEDIGKISAVDPGDTASMEFTAPDEPTTLSFHCSIGDHQREGMEGIIEVVSCEEEEEESKEEDEKEYSDEE